MKFSTVNWLIKLRDAILEKDSLPTFNGSGSGTDGVDGKDGVTPHIGSNGNWFIGSTDTGVSATGKTDSSTGYIMKVYFDFGIPYSDELGFPKIGQTSVTVNCSNLPSDNPRYFAISSINAINQSSYPDAILSTFVDQTYLFEQPIDNSTNFQVGIFGWSPSDVHVNGYLIIHFVPYVDNMHITG